MAEAVGLIDDLEFFLAAIKLPPEQRLRLLSELPNTDQAEKQELAKLLELDLECEGASFAICGRRIEDLLTFGPEEIDETRAFNPSTNEQPQSGGLPGVGQQCDGYRILKKLGEGGMGLVYLAEDLELGRQVAIKFLQGHDTDRFRQETRVIAALQHPNIVSIHRPGSFGNVPYFVMEFVAGETLRESIHKSRDGILAPVEAANIVLKAALAIQFAHEAGVLHRDLKPSNILIDANGEPKVSDFGLAKRLDDDSELTFDGMILGTPQFMAPEQADPGLAKIGPQTDVYGLGATLYTALTGRPPFSGTESPRVMRAVVTEVAPSPRQLASGMALDLDTICMKCLEKEPAKRFATAAELAADLRRFLNHEPILARPVGRIERIRCWSRRKPAMAGLVALGCLLALLLVGWGGREFYIRGLAKQQLSEILVTRANLLSQQGRWREALEDLEAAERLGRIDPREIQLRRIEAMIALSDTAGYEREIKGLDDVAPLGDYEGEAELIKGMSLLMIGDKQKGVEHVQKSLRHELPPAKREIGLAVTSRTSLEVAAHLTEAARLEPTSHFAQQYLTSTLVLLGRYQEARNRCESAKVLFPESPTFPMLLLFVDAAQGNSNDLDVAEKLKNLKQISRQDVELFQISLRAFQAITEKFTEAWCMKGSGNGMLEDTEELSPEIQRLVAKWGELVESRSGRGRGQSHDAFLSSNFGIPCIQEAMAPLWDMGSLRTLGFLTTGQGSSERIDRLIGELDNSYQIHPDGVFPYCRGRLHFARGQFKEAIEAFELSATSSTTWTAVPFHAAYSAMTCGYNLHGTGQIDGVQIARRNLDRCLTDDRFTGELAKGLLYGAETAGDYDGAVRIAEKCNHLDGLELRLAKLAYQVGRLGDAWQHCEQEKSLQGETTTAELDGLRIAIDQRMRGLLKPATASNQ